MIRPPPRSTRTDTRFPYTTLFRSFAYTLLNARVREDYQAGSGTPCTALNTTVQAGKRIPGIAESNAYVALNWGGESGWHAGTNVRYLSRVAVNDTNSEAAPSYATVGLDGGYVFDLPAVRVRTFINLDNLLDRDRKSTRLNSSH